MALARGTIRVFIATPYGPGGSGGIDRLTDLIVGAVNDHPAGRIEARTLTTYGPGKKLLMPFVFLGSVGRLLVARMRGEIDVLHINVAGGGSAYRKAVLARVAHALAIPYVVHLHGSRFHETWPGRHSALRGIVDAMLLRSAVIIALGQFWFRHVTENLPPVTGKVIILPNATPATSANPNRAQGGAPVQITFVGLLGARKGTFQLIAALGELVDLKNWRTTIAGDGDVERHRNEAAKYQVAERIDVTGRVTPSEVQALLNRTDIFVLPSFAENLPMAIIEAFAHGVPVVTTPVGAIPEVVLDGVTGLIVPVGDTAALAGALRKLIENPDLRATFGDAARREHAARYELSSYVDTLARIWRDAAKRPSR